MKPKRLLVTGGSRGLGLAICRLLLGRGYRVVTCARTQTPDMVCLSKRYPNHFQFHAVDLGRPGGVQQLSRAADVVSGFDGFVANAAISIDGILALVSPAKLELCVQLNLTANLLLAREVIRGMLTRGGTLVFVSSIAAKMGWPGLSVYSATKGGLISFSRCIAREYGERGIRSNVVLPGFLETEMSRSLRPQARERIRRRTALKRFGTVEEVAGVVDFLLSDAARFVTGTEIVVDGGFSS